MTLLENGQATEHERPPRPPGSKELRRERGFDHPAAHRLRRRGPPGTVRRTGRQCARLPGEKGGPLRPHVLQKAWVKAKAALGAPALHLHDLRHAGNSWAAATGASTKELMARMGHANSAAALCYQHATADRDRAIADALSALARPAAVVPLELAEPSTRSLVRS